MACIVRGVCWGNIQRSPTFEAVFNWTISEMRLPLKIKFDSAGIMVDRIMRNETPVDKKRGILETGKTYGLDYDIPKDDKAVTELYAGVKDAIHAKMMGFRNDALREAGIPEAFIPGMRVPFRHDRDLKLIVGVDNVVMPKLKEYYSSLNTPMPKCVLYGDLVGEEELEDKLKGGMELAREQVDYFMRTRFRAIERIVELLGHP